MTNVNLHQHTEGSFLDGEARPRRVFERAKELGMEHVVFTDHGECNQHLVGAKLAQEFGMGFIPGMEGYWLTAERLAKAREEKRYPSPSHICLLAANNTGLSNLWALSSESYTEPYFYHKPNATPELLRTYSEGLYASDGCFSGSERFSTLEGTKTFTETVGTTQKVLGRPGRSPVWVDAEIKSFGGQRIVELVVCRDGRRKTIQTTANHRWFVGGRNRSSVERVTADLRPGDRLVSLAPPVFTGRTTLSAVGIQAGIVFGDGTADRGVTGRRSARVKLYGTKDAQLLKWFPLQLTTACATEDAIEVRGLPGYFKDAPSLSDSSLGYLYGWLAGYFAADGCVTRDGSVQLASARRRDVQLVRDVCQILGIRTGAIRTVERVAPLPRGGEGSNPLHYVTLDATHLGDDFFLVDQHRERAVTRRSRRPQGWSDWRVESVVETERWEEVFCAVVPRGQAFTLEDDLFTGNCMMTDFAVAIDNDREDEARQLLGLLREIYRERFYMELHTWQYIDLPPIPERPPAVVEAPDSLGGYPLFMAPQESKDAWAAEIQEGRAANTRIAEMHRLNALMTKINQAKVRFAHELGVPLVVVNDAHHAYPEDWYNKELVWQFNTGKNSDQVGAPAQKADHLMGDDELYLWMRRHGITDDITAEAIKNSQEIAANCQVIISTTLGMPQLAASETDDLHNLIKACEEGFAKYVVDEGLDQDRYMARLEEELTLISEKRFAGYFNMVRDYSMAYRSGSWSQYVKKGHAKEPMLLGPGRGSVGGSLVAYLCGIDIIDPVKYGTLFSRFLSPGRKGLPDVDMDVPRSQRPDALKYFTARFGQDNVCAIGTLSRNGPKAILKDLGRAMHIPFADLNTMSAHIEEVEAMRDSDDPDEEDLTWGDLIERKGGELTPWAQRYPELFERLGSFLTPKGPVRHAGVHAAGVLVSSVPLRGAVPLRRNPKTKVISTQFDMWEVEELGGVKLDLLGIRHLDTLSVARKLIYERHGVWIDYDRSGLSVPQDCTEVLKFGDEQFRDPVIWPQIDAGQTTGIFQVETPNCTNSAVVFRPRSETDVADLTSIIRPGVNDAGLKEVYLRRRHGLEPVVYDHPLMERFVGPSWVTDTFGVLVYQEQLMDCVGALAGFTADERDGVRSAVGKKLMDKLMPFKEKFIAGCTSNEAYMSVFAHNPSVKPREIAEKIWHSIEASGRYAFNWSHAVGYAIIATWEIWTKHYYPQEFLVALMATDTDNINRYIREARRRGIAILPPDINKSASRFTIEGSAIRYGIDTVRGVGAVAARHIQEGRPYTSFEDYLARAQKGADKTAAYNLTVIGAFDEMGDRTEMLGRLERHRVLEDVSPRKLAKLTEAEKDEIWADKRERLAHKYAIDRPNFADPKVVYEIEKELVGTYVTVDPMSRYLKALDGTVIRDPQEVNGFKVKEYFAIGGQIIAIRPTVTKKGRNPGQAMAHITVQWNEEDFRIVVFPEAYARLKILLEVGAPVVCEVQRLDSGCCLQKVERLDRLFDRAGIA